MSSERTIITDPGQITPQWLTQALREGGCLSSGEVVQVQVAAEPTYTSTVARLAVSYSAGAPATAPTRLFLKLSRPDSQQRVVGSAQRRREVEFHSRVAALMPRAPLVRCHGAAYCEETGASLLLFDDLAQTHCGGISSAPPGKDQCASVIDAFADFHAFWWDNPALHTVAPFPCAESVASEIAGILDCFPGFADFAGDRLSPPQRRWYESVLAALPRLLQRVARGENLTLIHGDANLSNVLLPHDAASGHVLIIDWQLWGVSYAAEDLANLMALFWDGDQRRALERDLLVRYHTRLVEHGVERYTWDDCWHDYRLAVIARVLFMPMWFWSTGAPLASVWASLANAWQAFEDLACSELLGG